LKTFCAICLRLSELPSLTITDLNFPESLIHIRHGKGDRPRLVPIGSHCRQWLESYLRDARPILQRGTQRAPKREKGVREKKGSEKRGQESHFNNLLV
jgi:site-specific recombinase XerD